MRVEVTWLLHCPSAPGLQSTPERKRLVKKVSPPTHRHVRYVFHWIIAALFLSLAIPSLFDLCMEVLVNNIDGKLA